VETQVNSSESRSAGFYHAILKRFAHDAIAADCNSNAECAERFCLCLFSDLTCAAKSHPQSVRRNIIGRFCREHDDECCEVA
jgi:hypothetical protein